METGSVDRVATTLAATRTRRGALRALAGAALGAAGLASAPGAGAAGRRRRRYETIRHSGGALCVPEVDVDEDPQTCNQPLKWDSARGDIWGRPEPTPLAINLMSPRANCSDLHFVLTWEDQDAVHSLVIRRLSPGERNGWQQLGSLSDRVRRFSIDAIGVPGGCNEGRLDSFAVNFDLRTPR